MTGTFPSLGTAASPGSVTGALDPMQSRPFRVLAHRQETDDTVTLRLEPDDGVPLTFAAGQFAMLGLLGVGEVPISFSGFPGAAVLQHTVRDVGGVTHALVHARLGDLLDVRGPYGTSWDVLDSANGTDDTNVTSGADGIGDTNVAGDVNVTNVAGGAGTVRDVVLVAGGIGLAPLRPALLEVLMHRERFGRVVVLYGARSPADVLFADEHDTWRAAGVEVAVTVDYGPPGWAGRVGLVTALIPRAGFDPSRALALICGPEVMMRYAAAALLDRGVAPDRVRLSMERTMKCGVGLCGHCQLRELFVCVDGPVLPYAQLESLLRLREV